MAQEVAIKSRTEIPAATIDEPDRTLIQIQYQLGELPPHFVYVNKKGYTKEKEAKAIQDDIKKRLAPAKTETITLE